MWNIFNEIKHNHNSICISVIDSDFTQAKNLELCEGCLTNSIIYDCGNYICNNCGIFQRKRLSNETEYRFYGESDSKNSNPERLGMPTNSLLPESSIGSVISSRPGEKYCFRRMIMYDSWNKMPYKERSQYTVFTNIARIGKKNDLPPIIIEQAKEYYKFISESSISRGSNRNGLIASCIYMACKKENVPRTSKEIAEIFNIELHDMTRGCKKFKELIRLNENEDKIKNYNSNSLDYIDRFCSKLNLSINYKNICEFATVMILCQLSHIINDNTAPSIAAVSIFIVCDFCNINISKKDISQSCKISEVTISKCYKKIHPFIKYLLPKDILEKYKKI